MILKYYNITIFKYYNITGKVIGVFGQEQRWLIEPFIPGIDDDFTVIQVNQYLDSLLAGSTSG